MTVQSLESSGEGETARHPIIPGEAVYNSFMAEEMTSQLRPQLLGRMTQRAMVETLKAHGPMSRADISRLTGISPTTVSSAVVQLLKAGLVEETNALISGPGRPGKILRFAVEGVQVIGISVEPEWCEVVAGSIDGSLLPRKHLRFATPNTYARLMVELEQRVRKWIESPGMRTLGIGMSLPGLIDPSGDRAAFSPNFHQTDNEQPGRDLSARLGLPTVLVQESEALCLAEHRLHRQDHLAIVDFTGGLGFGRLVNGRLLNRNLGLPSELGHLTLVPDGVKCGCGNRGCIETIATDAAFTRIVNESQKTPLTVDEVCSAVQAGQIIADRAIDTVLNALAIAVAAIMNLYSPSIIALHGRFVRLQADLLERLTAKAREQALVPLRDRSRIVLSRSTKAEGAVVAILNHIFEELGPLLPTTK
jgi:predicted NBD/HSP70 family sugar kinase